MLLSKSGQLRLSALTIQKFHRGMEVGETVNTVSLSVFGLAGESSIA